MSIEKSKWIKDAIKHPGSLKKSLHVPEDENIPYKKLKKAMHARSPLLKKRAILATTLRGFHD